MNDAQLTIHKAMLVQNGTLGLLAIRELSLQKYIMHGQGALQSAMTEAVQDANKTSLAEFASDSDLPFLWDPVCDQFLHLGRAR